MWKHWFRKSAEKKLTFSIVSLFQTKFHEVESSDICPQNRTFLLTYVKEGAKIRFSTFHSADTSDKNVENNSFDTFPDKNKLFPF